MSKPEDLDPRAKNGDGANQLPEQVGYRDAPPHASQRLGYKDHEIAFLRQRLAETRAAHADVLDAERKRHTEELGKEKRAGARRAGITALMASLATAGGMWAANYFPSRPDKPDNDPAAVRPHEENWHRPYPPLREESIELTPTPPLPSEAFDDASTAQQTLKICAQRYAQDPANSYTDLLIIQNRLMHTLGESSISVNAKDSSASGKLERAHDHILYDRHGKAAELFRQVAQSVREAHERNTAGATQPADTLLAEQLDMIAASLRKRSKTKGPGR